MADESEETGFTPQLSAIPQQMVTNSQLYQIQSGRRFSGDGAWTEASVICAVVEGRNKDVALSKAAAAFANRDGRPAPLFDHTKADTYDLAFELESLSLAISDTPWSERQSIIPLATDEANTALEQIESDSDFDAEESIVFNEWGEKITSKEDFEAELNSVGDDGWIIVGVGLKPTGAGEGNDDYIGNTYDVFCRNCGKETRCECVNIVYEDDRDSHAGVWTCQNCGTNFRSVHPRGPAGAPSQTDRDW